MNNIYKFFTMALVVVLSGCVTPDYVYQQSSTKSSAFLTTNAAKVGLTSTFVANNLECNNIYHLKESIEDQPIPAGQITWVQFMTSANYVCTVSASFLPEKNVHYYAEYSFSGSSCGIELYQLEENRKIPVPSAAGAKVC